MKEDEIILIEDIMAVFIVMLTKVKAQEIIKVEAIAEETFMTYIIIYMMQRK